MKRYKYYLFAMLSLFSAGAAAQQADLVTHFISANYRLDDEGQWRRDGVSFPFIICAQKSFPAGDQEIVLLAMCAADAENFGWGIQAPSTVDLFMLQRENKGGALGQVAYHTLADSGYNRLTEMLDVVRPGEERYGFILTVESASHGYATKEIMLLIAEGNTFLDVASFNLESDNGATIACAENESQCRSLARSYRFLTDDVGENGVYSLMVDEVCHLGARAEQNHYRLDYRAGFTNGYQYPDDAWPAKECFK